MCLRQIFWTRRCRRTHTRYLLVSQNKRAGQASRTTAGPVRQTCSGFDAVSIPVFANVDMTTQRLRPLVSPKTYRISYFSSDLIAALAGLQVQYLPHRVVGAAGTADDALLIRSRFVIDEIRCRDRRPIRITVVCRLPPPAVGAAAMTTTTRDEEKGIITARARAVARSHADNRGTSRRIDEPGPPGDHNLTGTRVYRTVFKLFFPRVSPPKTDNGIMYAMEFFGSKAQVVFILTNGNTVQARLWRGKNNSKYFLYKCSQDVQYSNLRLCMLLDTFKF